MTLKDYLEILAYDIAFWSLGLRSPDTPIEQLGELAQEVSGKLRTAAIIVLLVHADNDAFCHNLIRSGMARKTYLQRLRDAGLDYDHHLASGRYAPVVDTIAAGDWSLARGIAALSPVEWKPRCEYEDDFCFAQILHHLVAERPEINLLEPLFMRFEKCLDGASDPRLDTARAIAHRSTEAFAESFAALLQQRGTRIEADKVRGQMEEPQVIAQRQIDLEALALLRLAERFGITTEKEYIYCPALARLAMVAPFPGE